MIITHLTQYYATYMNVQYERKRKRKRSLSSMFVAHITHGQPSNWSNQESSTKNGKAFDQVIVSFTGRKELICDNVAKEPKQSEIILF